MSRFIVDKCVGGLLSSRKPPVSPVEKAPLPEDRTLYRMPFAPTYSNVSQSLRDKGWLVTLEVNGDGELEYIVQLAKDGVPDL